VVAARPVVAGKVAVAPPAEFGVWIMDPSMGVGAEGIPVAVDTTEGERIEVATDAEGMAIFALDIDDVAGIIAHADGRSFSSVSPAVAKWYFDQGYAVTLFSWPLEAGTPDPTVLVSGALENKTALANYVHVSTTVSGEQFNEAGTSTYEAYVPQDLDFTVVAREWSSSSTEREIDEPIHGWAIAEQAGVSSPTTLDLDLSMGIMPGTVIGSVAAPASDKLATEGRLEMRVWSEGALTGVARSTAPMGGDAGYDFTLEYVSLADLMPFAEVSVSTPDGYSSVVQLDGVLPASGAQDLEFLPPPEMTSPVGAGPHPWATPVTWTVDVTFDPTNAGIILVYFAEVGQLGVVNLDPSDTTFVLPDLPSTSTELAPGLETFVGTVILGGSTDADPDLEKSAGGPGFEVESPF
jgi:hypothetical protein